MSQQNPFLRNYDLDAPLGTRPREPENSVPTRANGVRKVTVRKAAASRRPGVKQQNSPKRKAPPIWLRRMLILLMATALVPIAKKAFDVIGAHFDSKPAVTILHADPVHDEIFSIKLQVRDDEQAGRKVLGSSYLYAGQAFERWNSVAGRHIYGYIPRRIPFFIPQPRAGLEGTFKELADKGFKDIDLYIFPFTSDADLYKTAKKCGLGRSGRDSILQWSAWREGDEKTQTTKCQSGGLCVLLSRGCDDDAFPTGNVHRMRTQ